MKKCKRIFQKRIFPLFTVFMFFLSALVVSAPRAEAAVLNYNDYIQSIDVDADKDIVSVNFGFRGCVEVIVNNDWSNTYRVDSGAVIPFDSLVSSGQNFQLRITIFRGDFLSLKNIPRNTSVSISLDCTENLSSYSTPLVYGGIAYYDTQYIYKGTHSVTIGRAPIYGIHTFDSLFSDIPLDMPFCNFLFEFKELSFNSVPTPASVTVKDFSLTMSISSLYRLQQEVGETNEILEAVKAELIDQGTTLDAVLTKLGVIEGKIDSGLSWLQSIYTTLQNIFSGIQSLVSSLGSSIGSGIQQITSGVASLVTGQQQTNSDLDEIINGGEIVDPGVSDAVDQFDDQISGVTDFENQVQNDFSQQFDAVLADFDGIGDLGPAFNFLGGYAGTLFVSLQDYSFIIILPIMIGVFMAICQHFPRGSLRGRSYSERVSFSQSELQSHRDAQSELASTRSWVDRDS